MLYMIILITLV